MKKFFSPFLIAITLFSIANISVAAVLDFPDVSSTNKNALAIATLKEMGVVKGDASTGKFAPDRVLNRAEYAKMIVLAKGWSVDDVNCTKIFPDLDCAQWYGKYIVKANQEGIIKGTGEGKAEPSRQVLMVEALAMTLRANNAEVATPKAGEQWFTPYLTVAQKDSVLSKISAGQSAGLSRAEAAQMIINALVKYEDLELGTLEVSSNVNSNTNPNTTSNTNSSTASCANGKVYINGVNLKGSLCDGFVAKYGEPGEGNYWYDKKNGMIGPIGDGYRWFMQAGENYGTMAADSSNASTEYFLNGREMTELEVTQFMSVLGYFLPGRYFLDQYGNYGFEGMESTPAGNILVAISNSFPKSGGGSNGGSGDNFYSNWYTDTRMNSSGGAGYISVDGVTATYGM